MVYVTFNMVLGVPLLYVAMYVYFLLMQRWALYLTFTPIAMLI